MDAEVLAVAARRAWRIALVAYLIPVSIATHWPRLGFPGGGTIDKFVHFLAFGVLAWLWMHARPFGRASAGWLIAAAWVYLDERTQAIEILGRTFSLHDMIAGWLGVAIAGALYAARTAATAPRTAERTDAQFVESLTYSRASSWLIAGAITLIWILLLGGAMVLLERLSSGEVFVGTFVYAIGFAGLLGIVCATVAVESLTRAQFSSVVGRPLIRPARMRRGVRSLATMVGIALLLMLAFRLLVLALFGSTVPDELAVDHEGFRVLTRGYSVAVAVLSIAAATALLRPRAAQ